MKERVPREKLSEMSASTTTNSITTRLGIEPEPPE